MFAFFDLDGTILSEPSLPSFYHYFLTAERPERATEHWRRAMSQVTEMREQGVPRENLNRWFYNNHFAGIDVERVRERAIEWLDMQRHNRKFFNDRIVRYIRQHRAEGIGIVLITGSFRELVAPLAWMVGAQSYICAPLEERDGIYTGSLTSDPTIGYGKSAAVDKFLALHDGQADQCFGYADDHSDIPFLERLGRPRVLASGTRELLAHANQRGWTVIDA